MTNAQPNIYHITKITNRACGFTRARLEKALDYEKVKKLVCKKKAYQAYLQALAELDTAISTNIQYQISHGFRLDEIDHSAAVKIAQATSTLINQLKFTPKSHSSDEAALKQYQHDCLRALEKEARSHSKASLTKAVIQFTSKALAIVTGVVTGFLAGVALAPILPSYTLAQDGFYEGKDKIDKAMRVVSGALFGLISLPLTAIGTVFGSMFIGGQTAQAWTDRHLQTPSLRASDNSAYHTYGLFAPKINPDGVSQATAKALSTVTPTRHSRR